MDQYLAMLTIDIPGYVDDRIMKGTRAAGPMQSLVYSVKVFNPVISSKLYWSISVISMLYSIEI